MSKQIEEYKAMIKIFKKSAETLEQLCELEESGQTGDDFYDQKEELESKFMLQMIKLSQLSN